MMTRSRVKQTFLASCCQKVVCCHRISAVEERSMHADVFVLQHSHAKAVVILDSAELGCNLRPTYVKRSQKHQGRDRLIRPGRLWELHPLTKLT